MIARWPACTPSKTPIATALRPQSRGTSANDRQISTPDSLGCTSSRRRENDQRAQPPVALLAEGDDRPVGREHTERARWRRFRADRLAVAESLRLFLAHVDAWKGRCDRDGQWHDRQLDGEVVERPGVGE